MSKSIKLQTSSILPGVKTYGYFNGSQSPGQSALNLQTHENNLHNDLNQKHSGGGKSMRVIVPQPSTHGMTQVSPNNGNANSVKGASTLLQNHANAEFDNQVGKNPPQTGGKKKKSRRKSKQIKNKKRKTKKRKTKKRKTKKGKTKKGKSKQRK